MTDDARSPASPTLSTESISPAGSHPLSNLPEQTGRPGLRLLLVLALIAVLLFARLGYYGLWDDEADVAIYARNLWRFGDLLAWDGRNLYAYREGFQLLDLKNRLIPPLQYVTAAPFLGLFGETALVARLPFALVALSGYALWGWWLKREKATNLVQLATLLLVVGNVSLLLYSRQARYYSLSWVLSLGITYCYIHRRSSGLLRVFLIVGSGLLLLAHYMSYGALMVCLVVDYLLFELRKASDTRLEQALYLGSQLVFLGVLVSVYDLFGRTDTAYVPLDWWADKLKLFWWNLRDLNASEALWLPIIPLALLVFVLQRTKDFWLLRGVIALVLYAFVCALLSPQPVGWSVMADVRYLSPTIPLGIFITVRTLTGIPNLPTSTTLGVVGCLAFTSIPCALVQSTPTNATSQFSYVIPHRSTLVAFLTELIVPQRSAYRETSNWLNRHLESGSLVLVRPDYAVFPLQVHSPQHRYMWLLRPDQRSAYPNLPDYVFKGEGVPDVVIAFGPEVQAVRPWLTALAQQGIRFEPPIALGVAGPDRTRPEVYLRNFATAPLLNPDVDGTYIFRKVR